MAKYIKKRKYVKKHYLPLEELQHERWVPFNSITKDILGILMGSQNVTIIETKEICRKLCVKISLPDGMILSPKQFADPLAAGKALFPASFRKMWYDPIHNTVTITPRYNTLKKNFLIPSNEFRVLSEMASKYGIARSELIILAIHFFRDNPKILEDNFGRPIYS